MRTPSVLLLCLFPTLALAAPPKAQALYFLTKTLYSTIADLTLAKSGDEMLDLPPKKLKPLVQAALKRTRQRAAVIRSTLAELAPPEQVAKVQLESAARMESIAKTFEKDDTKAIVDHFAFSPKLKDWITREHPELEIYATLGGLMGSFEGITHWAGVPSKKKPFVADLSPALRNRFPASVKTPLGQLSKLEGKRIDPPIAKQVLQRIREVEAGLKK